MIQEKPDIAGCPGMVASSPMISNRTDPAAGLSSDALDATRAFFSPGGGLAKGCEGQSFPYEHRPQQLEMAAAIAGTVSSGDPLVVEAGTGVGKSFAYLVPMIHQALARKTKVVVATHTISLQEQLFLKDVPFLQQHIGVPFRAALVKGRSNYLCLRRLDRARRLGDDLLRAQQGVELDLIREWADRTPDGSIQELDPQPAPEVWGAVCAEQGNCLWQKCPEYKQCFFMNARKRMFDADVLVVNHHVLFSELALRMQGASFLPPFDLLVIDEAHEMEDVACEHFGLRISRFMVDHWLRRLYMPDRGKGLLAALREGTAAHAVDRLYKITDRFFKELELWCAFRDGQTQKVIEDPIDVSVPLGDEIGKVVRLLEKVREVQSDEEMQAEVDSLIHRGSAMKDSIGSLIRQTLDDHVYWIEQGGSRKRNFSLHSAPIDVKEMLRDQVFDAFPGVVMTSATLAVRDRLEYFQSRVGAESAVTLQVGSPFRYEQQMRVLIPEKMPEPKEGQAYIEACASAVLHFVHRTQGRAFVLFTSSATMKSVARIIEPALTTDGFQFLVQGQGMARHTMLERFRAGPMSVLFGLDSFWAGVDVPGDALRTVIITRLPFAVPDLPLIRARMDRIRSGGGDPFRDYSLPEAVLRFRQGVGRLIRTATDDGFIVILDSRIRTKWYGRIFLDSLPDCPIETVEL